MTQEKPTEESEITSLLQGPSMAGLLQWGLAPAAMLRSQENLHKECAPSAHACNMEAAVGIITGPRSAGGGRHLGHSEAGEGSTVMAAWVLEFLLIVRDWPVHMGPLLIPIK